MWDWKTKDGCQVYDTSLLEVVPQKIDDTAVHAFVPRLHQ
jgi:hypothetical protein